MAVDWNDLDAEKFDGMTARETVRGVPCPEHGAETESLTKKQVATLVLIQQARTTGYSQIRHYPERPRGRDMLSPSVPETLEEKGYASVGARKQVSRYTGRGQNGFEKKQEGGYVNAYRSDDVLDALAEKLGFDSRFDSGLAEFMRSQMEQMA